MGTSGQTSLHLAAHETVVASLVQRHPDGSETPIGEIVITPTGADEDNFVAYDVDARKRGVPWRRGRIDLFDAGSRDAAFDLAFRALEAIGFGRGR